MKLELDATQEKFEMAGGRLEPEMATDEARCEAAEGGDIEMPAEKPICETGKGKDVEMAVEEPRAELGEFDRGRDESSDGDGKMERRMTWREDVKARLGVWRWSRREAA